MQADAAADEVVMTPQFAGEARDDQLRRVIQSVEAPDYDTQRLRVRLPWLTLVACVAAAGGLVVAWAIWRQSMADLWPLYWVALAVCWLITLFVLGAMAQRHSRYPFAWETPEALIVRAGAVASDAGIAPLAQTQPAPARNVWEIAGPPRVTELQPPRISPSRQRVVGVLLSVIAYLLFLMMTLALATSDGGVLAALSTAGFIAITVGAGLRSWLMRIPFSVTVGADGVQWRRGLRRRMLRWEDAQALCMIEREDRLNSQSQGIFWLQGPDGALVWASPWVNWAPEPLPDDAEDLDADDLDADDDLVADDDGDLVDPNDPARLCALAAAQTGLRLRDLTETVESFVTVGPRIAAQWRTLAPSFIAPPGSAEHARIVRLRAVYLWRLQALAAALLALSLALLGAGLGLLVAAPRMYGAQLTQAQRQAPIFTDTMTPATGQWTDSVIPGPPFEYFGGESEMIGDFYGNFALAAPRVRDGVVEVTVHHFPGSQDDWGGIVLRGDQAKNRVLVFAITNDGMWALDRLALKPNSDGFGPDNSLIRLGLFTPVLALRQGDDAVNRLAVIMRGSDYAFFINGQYVGSYHETQDTGDRVGVVAEGDSMLVGFTDFAVYPAPPASPLFPL